MATRPTESPTWAASDVVNPTSGQNNVVTPDAGHKNLGWDFKEKPPRQYFNWLGRLQDLWTQWFDQEVNKIGAGWSTQTPTLTSAPTGGEAGIGAPKRFTLKRIAVGPGFVIGMGFGMASFRLSVAMTGDEAYLMLDLPTSDPYGPYVPHASIGSGGSGDAPIIVPISARVSAAGIGTPLHAFGVVARDADDSLKSKLFLGSAEFLGGQLPVNNFWLTGNTYQISGCVIYPLNV